MGSAPDEKLAVPVGGVVDGKYRVDSVLGVGGMGCVVEATHLALLTKVAIKFIHASEAGDREQATRLLREARAARALTSEHVARVLDVGTLPSGAPYMVMEHLVGCTLEQRLARGPVPVAELAEIVTQTCDALAEAHAKGIVHRDIKPSNLFLVDRGPGRIFVKVLDFGISRVKNPEIAVESNLTGTESMLGTPHYMAPEQMTSTKIVDARADIWAIGVCMFKALTGAYPFQAETLIDLGIKVVSTDAPTVRTLRPDLDASTAAIVDRCLRRDPAARYASAATLGADLEELPARNATLLLTPGDALRGVTTSAKNAAVMPTQLATATPTHPPSRSAPTWVGLAAVGALGLGLLAVVAQRIAAPSAHAAASAATVGEPVVVPTAPTPPSAATPASAVVVVAEPSASASAPAAPTAKTAPTHAATAARAAAKPPSVAHPSTRPPPPPPVATAAPDER